MRYALNPDHAANAGLKFFSGKALQLGRLIEVAISIRHGVQRFPAKVVLLRELDVGFEVGVWLLNPDDVARIRLVERICQLESDILAMHIVRKVKTPRKTVALNTSYA